MKITKLNLYIFITLLAGFLKVTGLFYNYEMNLDTIYYLYQS